MQSRETSRPNKLARLLSQRKTRELLMDSGSDEAGYDAHSSATEDDEVEPRLSRGSRSSLSSAGTDVIKDTFEALIISNNQLTDVQRFHYLFSSLKGEAKTLIQNLAIRNNFQVAWQLVTQRYNNLKLIAMTHVRQLSYTPGQTQ